MADVDPVRTDLISRWERVLAGAPEVHEAVLWAEEEMDSFEWRDEVTLQGLNWLHDLWNYPRRELDDNSRERCSAIYQAWREEVSRFEADPVEWNRNYALGFVRRLPESMRERAASDFVRDGMLTDRDVVEFRFNN